MWHLASGKAEHEAPEHGFSSQVAISWSQVHAVRNMSVSKQKRWVGMLTKLDGRSTPTMPERLNKGKTVMSQRPPMVGQVSLNNVTIITISIIATVIITTISTARTFLPVTRVCFSRMSCTAWRQVQMRSRHKITTEPPLHCWDYRYAVLAIKTNSVPALSQPVQSALSWPNNVPRILPPPTTQLQRTGSFLFLK